MCAAVAASVTSSVPSDGSSLYLSHQSASRGKTCALILAEDVSSFSLNVSQSNIFCLKNNDFLA